jgi:uncharacterized protein (TIGR02145 family)
MAANKWGYSLDGTNYSKIPTASAQATIKNIDHYPSSSEKANTVRIGMKLNSSLPSGTYTKNVKFSVVAHETPEPPTMQTFNKSALANTGDSATLKDSRDGTIYTVKKLADGNVWMTQNLRIINKTLTSADSDVSSNFTIPASSISGFNAQNTNYAYVDSTYGGYYAFYTATAGTGGTSLTSGNAPSSICPKGWRLPTSAEYQTLYNNYNTAASLQDVPGFVLSGYVGSGSLKNNGMFAWYWSSTVYSANEAYTLRLGRSDVTSALVASKTGGDSMRCIAR